MGASYIARKRYPINKFTFINDPIRFPDTNSAINAGSKP